jgi:hypothetical protein
MERRKRSFPVSFEFTKPSRFEPPKLEMFYAHERKAHDEARAAALAADRPPLNEGSEVSPETSAAIPAAPQASPASLGSRVPPDFNRHARRCSICTHPDRDAIEADFIRWDSTEAIAAKYQIAGRASIYRHAHSTGLFAMRKRELSRVLEGILEYTGHIHASLESMDVIISAARVLSHLDDDGKWFEPPRTHIILTGSVPAPPVSPAICLPEDVAPAVPSVAAPSVAATGSPILTETVPRLENEPTP